MSGNSKNMSKIGRRYILNNKGPRTEPCGTPCVIRRGGDLCWFIKTDDVRFVIKEVNHLRAFPWIPMDERRWINILWSSVSNAADMSSRASIVPRLLLRPDRRSDVISVSADSVDLCGKYALCRILGILLSVR